METTMVERERVLEFLRAFINGGANQDFRNWAEMLYREMRAADAATACEGCDGTGGPNKSCAGCGGTGRRPSNTTKKHLNFGVVKEVQSA